MLCQRQLRGPMDRTLPGWCPPVRRNFDPPRKPGCPRPIEYYSKRYLSGRGKRVPQIKSLKIIDYPDWGMITFHAMTSPSVPPVLEFRIDYDPEGDRVGEHYMESVCESLHMDGLEIIWIEMLEGQYMRWYEYLWKTTLTRYTNAYYIHACGWSAYALIELLHRDGDEELRWPALRELTIACTELQGNFPGEHQPWLKLRTALRARANLGAPLDNLTLASCVPDYSDTRFRSVVPEVTVWRDYPEPQRDDAGSDEDEEPGEGEEDDDEEDDDLPDMQKEISEAS
ncbi:hypothetical protein BC834DRAFT_897808 [Gloeopeniophorella convolvens]|nr:hypothetical protein BC834DRAFT_897808 [Gloeopeniophorella convolvens]